MPTDKTKSLSLSFMEMFAERNANVIEVVGSYDAITQTWRDTQTLPSMRTNYQTWRETQRTTSTHTANGDYVPDFPSDTEPDTQPD